MLLVRHHIITFNFILFYVFTHSTHCLPYMGKKSTARCIFTYFVYVQKNLFVFYSQLSLLHIVLWLLIVNRKRNLHDEKRMKDTQKYIFSFDGYCVKRTHFLIFQHFLLNQKHSGWKSLFLPHKNMFLTFIAQANKKYV